jgi:hypothetical protein
MLHIRVESPGEVTKRPVDTLIADSGAELAARFQATPATS